jgi:hypothetical protein
MFMLVVEDRGAGDWTSSYTSAYVKRPYRFENENENENESESESESENDTDTKR